MGRLSGPQHPQAVPLLAGLVAGPDHQPKPAPALLHQQQHAPAKIHLLDEINFVAVPAFMSMSMPMSIFSPPIQQPPIGGGGLQPGGRRGRTLLV